MNSRNHLKHVLIGTAIFYGVIGALSAVTAYLWHAGVIS